METINSSFKKSFLFVSGHKRVLWTTGSAYGFELYSEGKVQSVKTKDSGIFVVSYNHTDTNVRVSVTTVNI